MSNTPIVRDSNFRVGLGDAIRNYQEQEEEFRRNYVSEKGQPIQHKYVEKGCMVTKFLSDSIRKAAPEDKQEVFEEAVKRFERKCEKSLIETFQRVNIVATVKSDPYSLPFQKEIVTILQGESYMNGAFEFYRVARKVVKQLLNEDVRKIRFYLYVVFIPGNMGFGKVEYRFRYFV